MITGQFTVDQARDLAYELVHVERGPLAVPLLEEITEAPDHVTRPLVVRGDVAQDLADFLEVGRRPSQELLTNLSVPGTLRFIENQHVFRRRGALTMLSQESQKSLHRAARFPASLRLLKATTLISVLSERLDEHVN